MQTQHDGKNAKIIEISLEISRLAEERNVITGRINALARELAQVATGNLPQDGESSPPAPTIGSGIGRFVPLPRRILQLVANDDRHWTTEEIARALNFSNMQTIQSTVSRMAKRGMLLKPDKRHVMRKDPFA